MTQNSPEYDIKKPGKVAIVALALLTAVGPLATDMYLSAMPTITQNLGTTASKTQLTLSAFMVGMAVGQFLPGPSQIRLVASSRSTAE